MSFFIYQILKSFLKLKNAFIRFTTPVPKGESNRTFPITYNQQDSLHNTQFVDKLLYLDDLLFQLVSSAFEFALQNDRLNDYHMTGVSELATICLRSIFTRKSLTDIGI